MTAPESNPTRWRRIEAIFHETLEQSPTERTAYLEKMCAGDTSLRRQIDALLKKDDGGEDILKPVASLKDIPTECSMANLSFVDPIAHVGARIGHYRLLEPIATGGMGTVWLAERADGQFERSVALKLIKRGMDTEDILHRFRTERQLLANLKHPNIAKLLDGGVTEDGRPYLVMEYIDGLPIDCFCHEQKLSIPERLELFQRVCTTVHEAHKNLVVHRDLKPSNILVTSDGQPKLLDFGIAKLLASGDAASVSVTTTGQRMLTPRYASPEQIRGEAVTTASDVYSLGVVLYELLTGSRPYNVQTHSGHELERVVLDREPTPPSIIVTRHASTRDDPDSTRTRFGLPEPNVRRLRRTLSGDLDTIIMTALRKEPERRYASAEGLASDIARFLRDDPITARPDSLMYRSTKFVHRNRMVVTAVAIVFLITLAGFIATLVLYDRAIDAESIVRAQRDEARWDIYTSKITTAQLLLKRQDRPQFASENLEQAPKEYRGWEYEFLKAWAKRQLYTVSESEPANPNPDDHNRTLANPTTFGGRECVIPDRYRAPQNETTVYALDCDSSGRFLISGSKNGVQIWDPDTGICLGALTKGNGKYIHRVLVHPDGRMIAMSEFETPTLEVRDLQTGEILWSIDEIARMAHQLDTDSAGLVIGCISDDELTVQIRTWLTGELVQSFAADEFQYRCVKISPNGRYIAAGTGFDSRQQFFTRVIVWDIASGEQLHRFEAYNVQVRALAWSPDSSIIAACAYEDEIKIWNIRSGESLPSAWVIGTSARYGDLQFTSDGKRLLIANESDTMRIWDIEHKQQIMHLEGPRSRQWFIAMPRDQRWLAAATDRGIYIWDTATPHERAVSDIVRQKFDNSNRDWLRTINSIETDLLLDAAQRDDAVELATRLQRRSTQFAIH